MHYSTMHASGEALINLIFLLKFLALFRPPAAVRGVVRYLGASITC